MSGPKAALEGPLLENLANNVSPGGRRYLRWHRRRVAQRVTNLQRLAYCGRVVSANSTGVQPRLLNGVAGFAGLQSCGSVWACSVCSARILMHRALEIGAVLGEAIAQGHPLLFITLTAQHSREHALADTWDATRDGWRRVVQGNTWQAQKELVTGFVRAQEVGYGVNGWHPHVHSVVVLEPGTTAEQAGQVAEGMYRRWNLGLERAGYTSKRVGQEWHLVEGATAASDLGGYLAKMANEADVPRGLGLELTHGLAGRSKGVTATVAAMAILDHFDLTGEALAVALWLEYEKASHGRRQVGWSRGLRERFVPDLDEVSDQDIVDEELGSRDDGLYEIPAEGWTQLVQMPGIAPLVLLQCIETSGLEASTQLLDNWGIPYRITNPGGHHGP